MCVAQVQVWHTDRPDTKVTVYALLDECSTGTFIKDDLLEKIDIPMNNMGPGLPVTLTTLNGAQDHFAEGVKGLKVQATGTHLSLYKDPPTKLPYTYIRSFLAVSEEEIATPDRISHWDHLASSPASFRTTTPPFQSA